MMILSLSVSSSPQYRIKSSTLSNGAGVLANERLQLLGVAGQAVVGTIQDPAYSIHLGFLHQSGRLITDVTPMTTGLPLAYQLWQNYPNPFNPMTVIKFALPKTVVVSIKVYDLRGQEVAVLVDGLYQAGVYKVVFDGRKLASGVYFYRMQAEDFDIVHKAMLVK